MAAAEPPPGAVQPGELQKPSAGSDARAVSANLSAGAEHKGEHDLMVATGYTGRPDLIYASKLCRVLGLHRTQYCGHVVCRHVTVMS